MALFPFQYNRSLLFLRLCIQMELKWHSLVFSYVRGVLFFRLPYLFIARVANANICAGGRARGGHAAAASHLISTVLILANLHSRSAASTRRKNACIRRFLEFVTAGRHAPRGMRKIASWMRKKQSFCRSLGFLLRSQKKQQSEWEAFQTCAHWSNQIHECLFVLFYCTTTRRLFSF